MLRPETRGAGSRDPQYSPVMLADASALALARCPGLTAERLAAALAVAGDPDRILRLPEARLRNCGWQDPAVAWAAAPDRAGIDRDREWLESSGAQLIACLDPEYPPLLRETQHAPAFLWVRGDAGLLASAQLAIVGSRNPTAGGRSDAHEFARYLAAGGLTITSGLALGIDGAAHRGALKAGGRTIAVCGTGLDTVYPREHAALADEIATTGTLVSEFPPRAPPLPAHFPQRNRVISGLALGVLVVEAASRSGSLSTARHAGEQGREVFAIPGSIHNPLSRGCHQLIRTGAKLVESAADILEELKIPFTRQSLTSDERPGEAAPRLDKEYEILLDALGFDPTGVDAIVERTGLPADSVASMLLILELEGHIAPYPGGRYGRIQKKR
ncbi:MAG TPA: DNA-processing protein DprA [Steroidobacteraceae bacterium]|nr:DNA-processing protein DprA [Steroidobacteraceae bacterium]